MSCCAHPADPLTPAQPTDCSVEACGGGIALVGPLIRELADTLVTSDNLKRLPLTSRAHPCVTLVMTSELAELEVRKVSLPPVDTIAASSQVLPLGVGEDPVTGDKFGMVLWPQGQRFRVRAKLPVRDFHVRLSSPGSPLPLLRHSHISALSSLPVITFVHVLHLCSLYKRLQE
jgi:hypothetical protein